MTDGSITFSTKLDNAQLEKDLAKVTKDIERTEQDISSMKKKRNDTQGILDATDVQIEIDRLKELKNELIEVRAVARDKSISAGTREQLKAFEIPRLQEEIRAQQKVVNAVQSDWNRAEKAVKEYNDKIEVANQKLDRQKTEAGALAEKLDAARGAAGRMGRAVDQAGTYLDRFTTRIKKLAARVFVFTLITTALRSMRTWLGKAVKTNGEATAAIARLKGALLTLAQPLVQVVIPAFTELVNVLTAVVGSVASFMSALFGTTVDRSAEAAKTLYDEQEALDEVGASAKKAGKSMVSGGELSRKKTAK